MMVKALLKTDSKNPEALAKALNADNISADSLKVECVGGRQVVTTVESKSLSTLISTLDDIVSCMQAGEKVMRGG
ncbi:MAG TPA: hypothetical protein ENN13_04625 [Candidatus Altiarchaeales archaeon]|nr:hypothetical protein [Candidatus Altiarchaeales archaeon]